MPASPCSAKQRSSRSALVALTPRMRTPWLRTSRTPTSRAVWAALATSGVRDWAWLTWVWMARLTPRRAAVRATRSRPSTTVGCSQCWGSPARGLVARRMARMGVVVGGEGGVAVGGDGEHVAADWGVAEGVVGGWCGGAHGVDHLGW